MIQAVQELPLTLPSNSAAITFSDIDIQTRNSQNWSNRNTSNFKVLGGTYDLSFSTNISSETAGVVAVGLFENGTLVPGTLRAVTIPTAGDYVNVSFDKEKRTFRGVTNLSIQSVPNVANLTATGTTETQIPIIANANLKVVRNA